MFVSQAQISCCVIIALYDVHFPIGHHSFIHNTYIKLL
jgi:hypothetical protein